MVVAIVTDRGVVPLFVIPAAFLVHRGRRHMAPRASDVDELHRLVRDFAGELRKLEEGLQILSAYVARMRHRSGATRGDQPLH